MKGSLSNLDDSHCRCQEEWTRQGDCRQKEWSAEGEEAVPFCLFKSNPGKRPRPPPSSSWARRSSSASPPPVHRHRAARGAITCAVAPTAAPFVA